MYFSPTGLLQFARVKSVGLALAAAPRLERAALESVLADLEAQGIDLGTLEKSGDKFARTMQHGASSHTYAFTTTGSDGTPAEFILSVSRTKLGAASYPPTNELLHHLYKKGIHVPEPIGRVGKYLDTEQSYMVTRFIHGTQPNLTELSPAQMKSLGREVARAHLATKDLNPEDFSREIQRKKTLRNRAGSLYRATSAAREFGRKESDWPVSTMTHAVGETAWRYMTHQMDTLPSGFVHNDLHPENLIFGGPQNLHVHLLDWAGFRTKKPLLHDIVDALVRSAKTQGVDGTPTFDAQKATAFLKGYNGVRRLTAKETNILPKMLFEKAIGRAPMEVRFYGLGEIPPGHDRLIPPAQLAQELRSYAHAMQDTAWIDRALTPRQHAPSSLFLSGAHRS